jgi:BASS family bile acid:Na+ symporter
LNQYAPKLVSRVRIVSPFIAVVAIVLIVASIIGQRAEEILKSGGVLLVAVTIMHGLAFSFGYFAAWFFGYEEAIRRTVAIEVGMQNSGLGSALATRHFSPSAATPCAISAVMHCIIGSALAGYWRWRSSREALNEKPPTSIETTDG